MDYQEAISYLLSFSDLERGVQRSANPTMSLASMRSLLSRLNDPHLGRKTIHITGSKGKGSTAAMIESILRREGYATSLFTSPHLHSFTERIAIDGNAISPGEFAAALDAIKPAVEDERASVHGNVSTFGILTALFFWLTRAQARRVEWQVVEVGLGGTFDTTNVFETPDAVVITPISLEHTAILGSTCAEIATDKSGLVKPGTACIMARQRDPGAAAVIRARCEEVGAELVDVAAAYIAAPGEHFVYGQSFKLQGRRGVRTMRTALLGLHQLDNAATAVATADVLRARGHSLGEAAIVDGVAHTRLHGRMEVMAQRPAVVGDGAHNAESAGQLAETLRNYFEWRRCVLVVGTMADKDLGGIVGALAPLASRVIAAPFDSPRARPVGEILDAFAAAGVEGEAAPSVAEAVTMAIAAAGEDGLVAVTGSLYVVAEARAALLGDSVLPS